MLRSSRTLGKNLIPFARLLSNFRHIESNFNNVSHNNLYNFKGMYTFQKLNYSTEKSQKDQLKEINERCIEWKNKYIIDNKNKIHKEEDEFDHEAFEKFSQERELKRYEKELEEIKKNMKYSKDIIILLAIFMILSGNPVGMFLILLYFL